MEQKLGISIHKLQSGPLGGGQQIEAKIAAGEINRLIFFWDPLTSQPHTADVQALLLLAVVWNNPVACNRASTDFMISPPLLSNTYQRFLPDYHVYSERLETES